MKSEVWRGQNSARFIYYRYKDSPYFSWLILSISLVVCLLLIFKIIIPGIQDWFSLRDEAIATRQRITILRANTFFASTLNKKVLDDDMQLAIRALPVEKDFGEIINAVVVAAVKSGVSVEDFSFNLGLVSSTSGKLKEKPEESGSTTKLSLFLSGSIDNVKRFITEISEKLPISQIESVETSSDTTNISLSFYAKRYAAPRINENNPIPPLSAENNSLFSKLSQWGKVSSFNDNQQTQPPSSEVPLF